MEYLHTVIMRIWESGIVQNQPLERVESILFMSLNNVSYLGL